MIPYTLYNYYGDLRPVEKMWPVCARYLDYLATREEADGGVTYGIGDGFFTTRRPRPTTLRPATITTTTC